MTSGGVRGPGKGVGRSRHGAFRRSRLATGGGNPEQALARVPAPRRPRGSVFPPELRPSILRFNVTVWFVTPTVLSCPFALVL